jgi:hypothetical protein
MDFTLCKVIFDKVNTCHLRRVLASALLIPSHASRVHNILELVLGRPSKKESKTRILVKSLEPRLHVSLKWKKHACGSGGVSIIT